MTDKRPKATKVKCKHEESLTKQSMLVEYSLLLKKHLRFAGARWQMNTTLTKIDQKTRKIGQIYIWNPMTAELYHVNIDLCHQYGISVAESQTFLRVKRPQRRRARRNGCFHRLWIRVYNDIQYLYRRFNTTIKSWTEVNYFDLPYVC